MTRIQPSRLLRAGLLIDAAGSGLLGAVQLSAGDWLAQASALPRALLLETGAFMIGYAFCLLILARLPLTWSAPITMIAAGNIAWAVLSVALLPAGVFSPSALGMGYLIAQAAAVLLFALLQFAGLRASKTLPPDDVAISAR